MFFFHLRFERDLCEELCFPSRVGVINPTLPKGLLGELITMAFVRGVILLASSSADSTQSPLDRTVLLPFCS